MTAPTISTEGLRELLERGAMVTVLDVRPAAERAEWSIPGSLHADAYEALRRGDPTVLAGFHPTNGDRVVTVCAAERTSMLAAERLRVQHARRNHRDRRADLRLGSGGRRRHVRDPTRWIHGLACRTDQGLAGATKASPPQDALLCSRPQ